MHDLIIRGGTVVDGTGTPPRTADLAVDGGVIVDVGRVGQGRQVIEADGAIVAPGWVDAHTHYDGQVTWDDALEGSAANGVTTVVMGNCGVGFAPVSPGKVGALIDLMEGVEDIPGTALYEGMPWGAWETFPEYLSFLDGRRWALDVGAQLAHGPLRFYVMGDRAIADAPANATDLEQMEALTAEAMRAGALGFSTSRILGHRSMSGFAVPGTFASEDEIACIARGIRAGGGILQAIPASTIGESVALGPEQASVLDEVAMLGRLSRTFDLPVTFTTLQIKDAPDLWRSILAMAADENAGGARLAPMIAPRGGTVLTTLQGYHVFMQRPTFLRLAHLPLEKLVAELRRPEVKAAILAERDVAHEQPGSMQNVLPPALAQALPRTFRLTDPLDYEPPVDQSLAAHAAACGVDPLDYFYDFLLEDGGTAVGVFLSSNYVNGNLDACREMLLDPYTVSGLSDAGAHVNFICDMSRPTFHLTHWVRDRSRGERLPMETAVAKATAAPARVFGLTDRGTLEIGKRADLNVIDLEHLRIERPVLLRDLPAGGQRFLQSASGYLATFVGGVQTRERDEDTGARPGRLARRPRA
jgi:N-acyl-D-aspartate/D-glutamate deacylase